MATTSAKGVTIRDIGDKDHRVIGTFNVYVDQGDSANSISFYNVTNYEEVIQALIAFDRWFYYTVTINTVFDRNMTTNETTVTKGEYMGIPLKGN
jgi:hypothetical protein